MLNRLLYWFVTLPSLLKVGCAGTTGLLFACSCLFVATLPGAYARGVAMETATALAVQSQATQVAIAGAEQAAATNAAAATATTQAEQAATATRVAAVARITATAIAAPTATAQAYLDETATSVAGVTATAQSYLDETATSVAGVTATAQAYTDATSTAIAVVTAQARQTESAISREYANATATVVAIEQATATAVAYDIEYAEVSIQDLVKGPERYKGRKFRISGQVFNIREEEEGFFDRTTVTYIQMWVQIPGGGVLDREAVTVRFENTLPTVFADDYIIVYGEGNGVIEGTNALGGTIRQPRIEAERIRF